MENKEQSADVEYRDYTSQQQMKDLLAVLFILIEKLGGSVDIDLLEVLDISHDEKCTLVSSKSIVDGRTCTLSTIRSNE